MANWTTLKSSIADAITTNGNQEITGALLQQVLNNIVNSVGENATFVDVATPTTNPGTPDGPVFYIAAAAGTYNNFGNIVVSSGEIVCLKWSNNIWKKKSISVIEIVNDLTTGGADKALSAEMGKALGAELTELGNKVSNEIKCATEADSALSKSISEETARAIEAEQCLEDSVQAYRYGYNVTINGMNGGIHTIETAIKDVPSKFRMLGQKITFRTENGDWATYHNESLSLDNYENVNDWVQEVGISSVTGDINISNNPDFEDLTEAADGIIKFADKEYSKESFSGLGRVYLRKNIVDGVNVLTQDMLSKPNTIYIIQYGYDLQDAEIAIPEGCVLDFQGGSFDNGSLNGKNTLIFTKSNNIFSPTLRFIGTWNTDCCSPEWFGAKGDGVTDDRLALQCAFDSPFKIVKLSNSTYLIGSLTDTSRKIGLIVPSDKIIKGNSVNNYSLSYTIIATSSIYFETLLQCSGRNITLDGIRVMGTDSYNVDYCIKAERLDFTNKWSTRNYFYKVNAMYANKALLALHTFTSDVVRFTGTYSNGDGIITYSNEGRGTGLLIRKASLGAIKGYGYNIQSMSYSSLMNCSIDYNELNVDFHAYRFYNTNAIGMYNCGAEGAIKSLSLTEAFGFNLESSIFVTKGTENYSVDIIFSRYVNINNTRLSNVFQDYPKFVSIDNSSANIKFDKCYCINLDSGRQFDLSYNNIECESIQDIDIVDYTIKEDYITNYITTLFPNFRNRHINKPIVITVNNTTNYNNTILQDTDNRITIFSDIYNSNIYSSLELKNNSHIVFKNNKFVSKEELTNYLFNIENSYVEFINCTFNISESELQSFFKIKNSTIKIINCDAEFDSLPLISSDSLGAIIVWIRNDEIQVSNNGIWRDYTPLTSIEEGNIKTLTSYINNNKHPMPINFLTDESIYSESLHLFNINTSVYIRNKKEANPFYISKVPCIINSCHRVILEGREFNISNTYPPNSIMEIKNSIVEIRDAVIVLKNGDNIVQYGFKLENATLILNSCAITGQDYAPLISQDSINCKIVIIKNGEIQVSNNGVFINSSGYFNSKPVRPKRGYVYFAVDTNINIPIYHKGNDVWVDSLGNIVDENYIKKGNSSKRPSLTNENINFQYFDTSLNKPIWWTGTKWVDATGADV